MSQRSKFTNLQDSLLILGINKHALDFDSIQQEYLPEYSSKQLQYRYKVLSKQRKYKVDSKRLAEILLRKEQDKKQLE
ncbi:hypothetical protein SS50377_23769 [Spironucleus salmonicida]|uniref:Uncharacterized protein n=1 Tax=Spironucleus salmonicida TaxID=348837 RepID=V6LQC3_9EUKA|nr:hypothetical protein SS50377_23769 [Spironucleus salmonicida]|eukprot:EST46448.1 Hypothetical protein SS50377_13532 [Spironucleus salmonicida]